MLNKLPRCWKHLVKMKLQNEDYISYEIQQKQQLMLALMNVDAIGVLLKWLDSKIKRPKKK